MSLYINRFIDKVQAAESKGEANIILPVAEAKRLHSEITKLLLALQETQTQPKSATEEVFQFEIEGKGF